MATIAGNVTASGGSEYGTVQTSSDEVNTRTTSTRAVVICISNESVDVNLVEPEWENEAWPRCR